MKPTTQIGNRATFLAAMANLASERRRDGAYDWGIYEDASNEETFHVAPWLEHVRQHQRDAVHRFEAQGDPAVRNLIAAERNEKS